MECEKCKSKNLVAGYYGNRDECVSVEQIRGAVGFVWKCVDSEKRYVPDSVHIVCRECGHTMKNPFN